MCQQREPSSGGRAVGDRLAQARCAKENHTPILLQKRNVVGVGLGHKVRDGENTGELSIVVSVTHKEPPTVLPSRDLVPRIVENVKTDVVETGVLRALPARSVDPGPRDRWRPVVPPGVSIGHYLVTAGTFGCLVHRDEELVGILRVDVQDLLSGHLAAPAVDERLQGVVGGDHAALPNLCTEIVRPVSTAGLIGSGHLVQHAAERLHRRLQHVE